MGGRDTGDTSGHTPIPSPAQSCHHRVPLPYPVWSIHTCKQQQVHLKSNCPYNSNRTQHQKSTLTFLWQSPRKINEYKSLCTTWQNTISWLCLNLQNNSWLCCMQRQRTSLYIPPLGFVHWLCRCLIISQQPITSLWCQPITNGMPTLCTGSLIEDMALHWRHSLVTKCSIHKIHQSFWPFANPHLHWCH